MSEVSRPKCRYCGSPVRKGTGLFVCGEGIAGNVHGGCRHDATAALIRGLYEQLEAAQLAGRTAERALMRIADGARSNPGGQVSEFAHEAAGNLRHSLDEMGQ